LNNCTNRVERLNLSNYSVGRDFWGEFDYGAINVMKEIDGHLEYMMSPIHSKNDEVGLPLIDKFVSMDITYEKDPAIGEKIQKIHRNRFDSDPVLVNLVQNLTPYADAHSVTRTTTYSITKNGGMLPFIVTCV
jgi:hypothetical protein